MEEIDICRKVCSVNGISPDENRNVNIDVGAKTVNNIAPDDNGNVTIEVSGGTVKSVNNVNPDANGNVSLATVASSGSYNDLSNKPSLDFLPLHGNADSATNLIKHSFSSGTILNAIGSVSLDCGTLQKYGNEEISDAPEYLKTREFTGNFFGDGTRKTVILCSYSDNSYTTIYRRDIFNGSYLCNWMEIPVISTQGSVYDANGCYHGWIRYTNGLQICWGKKYITDDNNRTVTYNVPFYDFPIVTAVCNDSSRMSVSQEETTSTVKFYVWDNNGNSRTYVGVRYIAIGKWR